MNRRAHMATFILGATAGIIATVLYIRSGHQWEDDCRDAHDWFDERAQDIRRRIGGGRRAVDRALDKADQTADRLLDSARSVADGAAEGVKSTTRRIRKAID